ncbi:2,5-diamino-6-(ribosylamino)-4(3H)-pyrimidinone 5'-phosphate reductase [Physocladia obscura]|uniref:2,5-diamino-6-ribosylamino-4(3H)-pyrimidinone 5'-phosphate reductase n=1 Tax=Physocladia obscura TaxID=109957 RepID=A0AAD5XGW9_9FUNG|nr:2,5-diamino-6-(ribosylamino)-4(3H)-pyrimidinone 5'-phosphate reductase [Physocladia obscura]
MIDVVELVTRRKEEVKDLDRPLVVVTYAQSIDGCIGADDNAQPLLLSGRESFSLTHMLRNNCAAILVGAGTAANDNPRLAVNADFVALHLHNQEHNQEQQTSQNNIQTNEHNRPNLIIRHPRPVVLDPSLRISLAARLVQLRNSPIVFCAFDPVLSPDLVAKQQALELEHVSVVNMHSFTPDFSLNNKPNPQNPTSSSAINIPAMLFVLKSRFNVDSLMVEGGASIISSFLSLGTRFVDQIIITIAPLLVGNGIRAYSSQIPTSSNFPSTDTSLIFTPHVHLVDPVYHQYGRDIVVSARVYRSTIESARAAAKKSSEFIDFSSIAEQDQPRSDELLIVPDFVPVDVHDALVAAMTHKLSRLMGATYMERHFDGVITGYKEASVSAWGFQASVPDDAISLAQVRDALKARIPDDTAMAMVIRWIEASTEAVISQQQQLLSNSSNSSNSNQKISWLPPHILELRAPTFQTPSGIGPHVDHLGAFGAKIAGVCLGSDAVMRFAQKDDPSRSFSALLPNRCLYFQCGSVRFNYTHEIPVDPAQHVFKNVFIERGRRISVLIRDSHPTQ